MRILLLLAALLPAALAGCERPQQTPVWYEDFPAFTEGWTLSYGAPPDDEAPQGRWLNLTFEASEPVGNWTTHRWKVTEAPPYPELEGDTTVWYDVASHGMVRQSADGFVLTFQCPLQDVRLEGTAEWSCLARSWHIQVRQTRLGSGTFSVAGRELDETHFRHEADANGAGTETSFSYSTELGFYTRLQSSGFGSPEPYVLQRVGSCRMDGMLMPDPSACGPWPAPRSPPSTSAPTP